MSCCCRERCRTECRPGRWEARMDCYWGHGCVHPWGRHHGGAYGPARWGPGEPEMSREQLARYVAHVKREIEDLERRLRVLETGDGSAGEPKEPEDGKPE